MQTLKISNQAKIALVYRPNTEPAINTAKALVKWLRQHKYKPLTAPDQKALPGAPLMKSVKEFADVELIIILGGDGTYLRAARLLEGRPIPILGVNLGSLGFLTPLRLENFFKVLPLTLSGNFGELLPRSQMLVQVLKGQKVVKSWSALNDVVIERGPSSHLTDLQLKLDDFQVSSVKADALVIATPTGSTAYNLAAGGPIVHPETPCFVATPVAPHSLTSRPLIFPDSKTLQIQLQGQCEFAHLVIDGQKCAKLTQEQSVKVSKNEQPHWMIQPAGHNFYELLREKLSFGERA
jgi:NAD+ kinase